MSYFIAALVPIIVLIGLGYLLKRLSFLSDAAWAGIEKLTYYIMFPALLIHTLGQQDIQGLNWLSILVVTFTVLLLSAASLWAWFQFRLSMSGATFTSVFQGGVRFNTYIALSVSGAYFGADGLAIASVASGFMIVIINLLCITAFVLYGHMPSQSFSVFTKQILVNPLIIGCAVGWFLSLSHIGLPGVSAEIFEIVGRAALPIGLLAVGAALKPSLITGHLKAIVSSSFVQFMLKPALIVSFSLLLGLPTIVAGVLLIAFTVPTASSAYILARQLGGDTETMASIITVQTLMAFVVMPIWAFLFIT